MATHGLSGIQRWLLGSVADKVLHAALNPMFLIRATDQGETEGEARLNKAIVQLDGSPLAEKVLPYVVELSKKMTLEIVLLRAYALPPTLSADDFGAYSDELINQLEAEAKDYLTEKIKELREKAYKMSLRPWISVRVQRRSPGLLVAPDHLIAMCTHGRSGVTRWVLGSVTERVVRYSGDPVLIIRAA
jgi:nucleotide-binding universal stress UspA family protein